MQYLWQFYLLVLIVIFQGLIIGVSPKHGKTVFILLCFIELTFIAGFRSWDMGNDTHAYIETFILSINYPELLKTHMEAGYIIFNRVLSSFTSNPQMLLITTSVFIIGVWLRTFYKYSIAIALSVLLFTILEYSTTLTMIRQEISVCIILLSIPFIVRRQLFLFLLMVVLASSFHYSAVLAISLYFLYQVPFNLKYCFITFVATTIVFLFIAPILDKIISVTGRYDSYKGNILLGEETKLASLVKTVIQFSITSFCYFSYKYVMPRARQIKSYLNISFLLWCSILALCVQFIAIRGTVMERLVLYFSSFNLISIPYFVHCYPKKERFFVCGILVFCFLLYKSIVFVYRPDWNYVLPFQFCF